MGQHHRPWVNKEGLTLRDLWYKDAIIYCLDVDRFMDGNGDGIGDFRGLK
jgi:hypothetical protein